MIEKDLENRFLKLENIFIDNQVTLGNIMIELQSIKKRQEIIKNTQNQLEQWRKSHINRPTNPHREQL